MSLSTTVKTIQDIMRKDAGVDGDAQRISLFESLYVAPKVAEEQLKKRNKI